MAFSCMSALLFHYKLWPVSLSLSLLVHQQKSLPALRLSLLNSQQSLTQPLQPGVKPAPGGTPPAIVAGPAVRIRHPNSVSTTVGASALPTGTLGHAAGMVCMEQSSGTYLTVDRGITCLDLLFTLRLNWRHYLLHEISQLSMCENWTTGAQHSY